MGGDLVVYCAGSQGGVVGAQWYRMDAMTEIKIRKSPTFNAWLSGLSDQKAKVRIAARIRYAELGNFGDAESVGGGVYEMRIDVGPGYRLYYTRRGKSVYFLLLGGDKSTQQKDIKQAIQMARKLEG